MKDPEKKKEIDRAYKQRPDIKAKEKKRKSTPSYLQKKRESSRLYYQKHKEYYKILCQARRARLLEADGSHTLGEWEHLKAQYNWTCPCCGRREPEISLTEDHVIPLSRGGSNNIENIQPLCKECNCAKATKIIKYDIGG